MAVGLVIVQGPTPDLRFSDDEVTKVVAEVQNGLGWYAVANPTAGISFSYDIQNVNLNVAAHPDDPDLARAGATPQWAHWDTAQTGTAGRTTRKTSVPGSERG